MRTSQYRSRVAGFTLTVLAVGTAGACSSPGIISSVTPEPSPAQTSPAAGAKPAETGEPAGPTGADDLTLDDGGIGGLWLGQSKAAALATGLVGKKHEKSSDDCDFYPGKGGIERVYMVAGKVSIISVGPSVSLARGIGVGDTYAQLQVKYPKGVEAGFGKLALAAPGAKVPAHYRIGLDSDEDVDPDSEITEIALQANDQTCYE